MNDFGTCDLCGKDARWKRVVTGCSDHKDILRNALEQLEMPICNDIKMSFKQVTNNTIDIILSSISVIVRGPLDSTTKVNKVKDILAGISL